MAIHVLYMINRVTVELSTELDATHGCIQRVCQQQTLNLTTTDNLRTTFYVHTAFRPQKATSGCLTLANVSNCRKKYPAYTGCYRTGLVSCQLVSVTDTSFWYQLADIRNWYRKPASVSWALLAENKHQVNGRGYMNSGTHWNALHIYFYCVPLIFTLAQPKYCLSLTNLHTFIYARTIIQLYIKKSQHKNYTFTPKRKEYEIGKGNYYLLE